MADIKPEQIPLEVNRAMRVAWARRNNSDAPEKHMADLIVAALTAWPGRKDEWRDGFRFDPLPHGTAFRYSALILPLPPQEASDER